jgi:hypothetical protein
MVHTKVLASAQPNHSGSFMFPIEHPTGVDRSENPVLHNTNSWDKYVLLEGNCSHACSFVRRGCEFSEIFSNAKDEAWSQYKHLHDGDNSKDTTINGRRL